VRTIESSHVQLQDLWGVEVISLRLVDPRFYHLDTCFCPLRDGQLLYFPAAFDAESNAKIEFRYSMARRIPVREVDALRFACNAINVSRLILMNEVSNELCRELEARGFEVVQVRLTEFLKAGGAAKCLVLRLSEMDVTHSAKGPATAV
jgi:ornithine--oxo-acid transaminase